MIIQLSGRSAGNIETGKNDLATLANTWGHELTEPEPAAPVRHDDKTIDPIELTTLILSIPATALAVRDLTDRIRKRRRASELIDHARQLSTQDIAVTLTGQHGPADIAALDPDQLLELIDEEDART